MASSLTGFGRLMSAKGSSRTGAGGGAVETSAGMRVPPVAWGSTCGRSLAARCTSKSRSIWEQRPSVTGSMGDRLVEFQWVRSRTCWIVVLAVRHRGVARPLLNPLLLRQLHPGFREPEAVGRILLRLFDLLAGQLARGHRIEALDAGRDLAIGDALHLKGVKLAEIGDLLERQRRILDEPNGRRLRHQRSLGHGANLLQAGRRTIGAARQNSLA